MRKAVIIIALTILASTAHGQTTEPADPDFSSDHLRQIFTTEEERPEPPRKIRFPFGAVDFRAFGMEWRIGYLPIFAPLHGSVPATMKVWPDAFSLNHTEIPGALPIPERDSDMRREIRRIARITAQ